MYDEDAKPEPGRGSASGGEQPESRNHDAQPRNIERGNRRPHQDRDREYNLRDSEVAALIEIAKFRSVKTDDLVEIQYQGNADQATQDLRNLTAQGLIQRRTLSGTEKEQILTVTRSAHAFLNRNRPQGLAANQSLHHGFVKTSCCMYPFVATQSISSLKSSLPGDTWRSLLQTFRTKIFLALSDDFSAQTASELCGNTSRSTLSTARRCSSGIACK
jgi:hypothetical protein